MLPISKKTWISSAHQGFVLEGMHSNTLSAFLLAAEKGADMIETDARTTKDGVIVCNHNREVKGKNELGEEVEYIISETDSSVILGVILTDRDPTVEGGIQKVPTLADALHLAYYTGLQVNIDLKEGAAYAEDIAHLVCEYGMRGRVVYATNGSGAETINKILAIDPEARFIDTPYNYTAEKLAAVKGYQSRCFAFTSDFSEENIARIRESGCMLAAISLNAQTAPLGFKYHPDMAEYPHTNDFEAIDRMLLDSAVTVK